MKRSIAPCGALAAALALAGCAGAPGTQPALGSGSLTQAGSRAPFGARALNGADASPALTGDNVIYSFKANPDANSPISTLVPDTNGDFFGVSTNGGVNGDGALFEIMPEGGKGGYAEKVVYSFSTITQPVSLAMDSNGNFFGAALGGGNGDGVIWELQNDGGGNYGFKIIHAFSGTDGASPLGALVIAPRAIYGTTFAGGTNGNGTVYELVPTRSGAYGIEIIHAFTGAPDGANPSGGVALLNANTLVGTTAAGGANNVGAAFSIALSGSTFTYTLVTNFTTKKKGLTTPESALIADTAGNLYGTAFAGGAHAKGGVFKLTPANGAYTLTNLYSFKGGKKDGEAPGGAVVRDANGNLWGMTMNGGTANDGVIYELVPVGAKYAETVETSFTGANGSMPNALEGLTLVNNVLFGVTAAGGANGLGAAFDIPL